MGTSDSEKDTCFLDIDEDMDGVGDFNRWGWSVGPLADGTTNLIVHGGAGQCDTSKGEVVGGLEVNIDGLQVDFNYSTNTPFTLSEVQFYAGCELLPRDRNGFNTVAPGQYPYVHDDFTPTNSYSGSLTLGESCPNGVYVVAHSVSCSLR